MSERVEVSLACSVCESRNYRTTRKPAKAGGSAGSASGPLTLKKFCPTCNKHTVHKETK
jgi:large subunit ribosomal protein L33